MKSTRREFLAWLGRATAAGAAFPLLHGCAHGGPLPFDGEVVGEDPTPCHALRDGVLSLPESSVENDRVYDVVIIGGGVAGVAAAWKLVRSGVDNILLIEKDRELGGTSVSGESDAGRFAWGAHYVESPTPDARYLLEIYEDLGVILDYIDGWPMLDPRYVVRQEEIKLFAGSQWTATHFPYALATSSDVAEYERFRQAMYRWVRWKDSEGRPAFGLPIDRTSPADEARGLDRVSMLDWLDERGFRSNLVKWYVNNRVMDEYGLPIDETSAWAAIQFWAQTNSSFTDFEPPGTPAPQTLSWPEGNAFLVNGMARRLRPDQQLMGRLAIRVESTEHGVSAVCYDPTGHRAVEIRARQAIYAAPKHTAYYAIPALRESERREFAAAQYVPWLTAAIRLKPGGYPETAPPSWETLSFDGWGLGYIDNGHMIERRPRDAPRVLTFYAALSPDMATQRQTLLDEGWEFWARVVLSELESMHPNIARSITRLDARKMGHAMVAMRPGFLWGSGRQAMKRSFGAIHFAGADIGGTPVFEQASYSGIEAAEKAMSGLGKPYVSTL